MNEKYFINIGRQLGSGGLQIGEKLSARLGIPFYDKELIQIASQESGLGKEFFEQADEKTSHSLIGGLFGMRSSLIDEIYSNYYLSNETLFQIQSDVIKGLAEKSSSIFIGRCADYVLKDYPCCLNVYISADINDRINRVAAIQQIPVNKARDFIEKMDKKRAAYYNYYSNKIWGAAQSYHLCINSSVLGIEETANLIMRMTERKFQLHPGS
jgi:shikimate kinase